MHIGMQGLISYFKDNGPPGTVLNQCYSFYDRYDIFSILLTVFLNS